MAPRVAFLVSTLLATALLAGCVGSDAPPEAPPAPDMQECASEKACGEAILDETGRDLRTELTKDDTLQAPTWQVGDVFEQHVYYGNRDTSGSHIVTMIVDDGGDCYEIATTDQEAAKTESVYDLPMIGCIGKTSLTTTAFGSDWHWMYHFPLEDGASWQGSIDDMINWNTNTLHDFEFTLNVMYHDRLDTPIGSFPGFMIHGITDDGTELLRYNYVPAIGWFSHFWMYDVTNDVPDGPDDVIFHAMSMGTRTNYTGPYYTADAETLRDEFLLVPFSAMEPGSIPTSPTITVPEGAHHLMGVIVPIACPGTSKFLLVPPGGSPEEYDHTYNGDPAACQNLDESSEGLFTVHYVDREALPGDWHYSVAGAGGYGYYLWIVAVTENEQTL